MTATPTRVGPEQAAAPPEVPERPPASTPDAVAPPPGNVRFPLFDGLRAIAALAIVVGHVSDSSHATADQTLDRPFFGLTAGVTLFFVISGFLLFRPYFRAQVAGASGPRVRDYARRRGLRIFPAYWIALAVLSIYPGLPGMGPKWWEHVLLVQYYDPSQVLAGIRPTWSLCVEAAFYIALPVIAFVLARATAGRSRRTQVVVALVALSVLGVASIAARSWALSTDTGLVARALSGFFGWFAAGMLLAVVSVAAEHARLPRPLRWVAQHPGACWLGALGVFVFLCVVPNPQYLLAPWATEDATTYFVGQLLLVSLLALPAVFDSGRGVPRRILSNRVVAWLGLVSYGIFLWHAGVIDALNPHGTWTFFPLLMATLALTIGIAAISYYVVERPLLTLKNGLGPLRAPAARLRAGVPAQARAVVGRVSPIEGAVLALVVITCAAVGWAFASQSWFFSDDFVLFHQVQLQGVHPGFLFERAIVHFAPGHRLFEIVVQRFAPLDFNIALGILLAFHCAAIVFLQRTLAAVFGRRWWTFCVALAFGLSFVFVNSLEWYSGGLLTIPGVAFSLACIHAYVIWWRTRKTAWLVWSVVALIAGLAFYEKTALVPLYLFGMTALLLDPGRGVAAGLRSVRPRVWALYAAPVVVLGVIYIAGNFADSAGTLDFGQLPSYLRIAWLDGFVPSLFGFHVPRGPTAAETVAVVLAQVLLVAAVVVTVARRRSAWRAWAFLAAAFLLNMLVVVPRLGTWGPAIGYETRYFTEIAMVAALIVPFAFALPSSSAGPPRLPSRAVAAVAIAALAAYVTLAVLSSADVTSKTPGRGVRAWVGRLDASLAQAKAHAGTPAIIDEPVPARVIPPFVVGNDQPPANLLSSILALRGDRARFDAVGHPTYRLTPSGALAAVAFVSVAGGDRAALERAGRLQLTGGRWTRTGATSCIQAGSVFATLRFEPAPALRGHRFSLRADYRTSPGAVVLKTVNAGVGYGTKPSPALAPAPGGASSYVLFDPLPGGVPTFAGVQLLVPGHQTLCFSSLRFGYLRYA